jgi:hypothetical protein
MVGGVYRESLFPPHEQLLMVVVGGAICAVQAMPIIAIGVSFLLFIVVVVVVVVAGPISVVIYPASRGSQRWWWGAVDNAVLLL